MTISDVDVETQVKEIAARSRNHIFCDCRPDLMFCGIVCRLDPAGDLDEMPDGDECSDCYLVWLGGYCPCCNNHWTADDYRRWNR